jgi:hypothetical protein
MPANGLFELKSPVTPRVKSFVVFHGPPSPPSSKSAHRRAPAASGDSQKLTVAPLLLLEPALDDPVAELLVTPDELAVVEEPTLLLDGPWELDEELPTVVVDGPLDPPAPATPDPDSLMPKASSQPTIGKTTSGARCLGCFTAPIALTRASRFARSDPEG